jgi:DNA end-binding protein Ku
MARAIWSGSVSFGLVNVPVKLYSAVRSKGVKFHQLDSNTGARVRQKRVSEKSGDEVPYEQIVKGYEVADGKYVTLEPEELEAMAPEDSRVVEIEDFVDLDQVDPIHYDSTYWLAPENSAGAKKAYALLVKAMEAADKVAIGRFVMRGKQHLAALRPIDGTLAMHTMVFPDEIVDKSSIEGATVKAKLSDRELKAAGRLIESLASDFKPERYKDTYRNELMKLIKHKQAGKEIVATATPKSDEAKVLDLMAALEASIAGRKKKAARSPAKKAAKSAKKQAKKSA